MNDTKLYLELPLLLQLTLQATNVTHMLALPTLALLNTTLVASTQRQLTAQTASLHGHGSVTGRVTLPLAAAAARGKCLLNAAKETTYSRVASRNRQLPT